MNRKAFTLIELLVVVAIIGILAAVGVVAYNGYTNAAKVNAVKQNQKLIVNFITAEIMKCQLTGEPSQLNGAKVWCTYSISGIRSAFMKHFDNEGWKNPFDNTLPVYAGSIGRTGISSKCCLNGYPYIEVNSIWTERKTGSDIENNIVVEGAKP